MKKDLQIGVLALQGAFREHRKSLSALEVASKEVRLPKHLEGIDALIIPGGESTTIGKLLVEWRLLEPIQTLGQRGLPIWGTCAGAIVLAERITERGEEMDQPRFSLLPMTAERNAFGRQKESFETGLKIKGLDAPFHAVFIRAPLLHPKDEAGMEILAMVNDEAVFVRKNHLFATSFHPELTDDTRIHRMFVESITKTKPT